MRSGSFRFRQVDQPEGNDRLGGGLAVEPSDGACTHDSSISVIESGRELVVCEGCGDVTVRYSSGLSTDVARSQFARKDGFLRLLMSDHQDSDTSPVFGNARA